MRPLLIGTAVVAVRCSAAQSPFGRWIHDLRMEATSTWAVVVVHCRRIGSLKALEWVLPLAMNDISVSGPELVFGLVGPLGTDLSAVAESLISSLAQVSYRSEVRRLSQLMHDLTAAPWCNLKEGFRDETIREHMAAGNELRDRVGRKDAVAMLSLPAMAEVRQGEGGESTTPIPRFAHILHSLKRPEEVESFRRIYGPAFILLAAYAPRQKRLNDLAKRIAQSRYSNQYGDYLEHAERLLRRDEAELQEEFGQNVQETFPLADIFIDTTDQYVMMASIKRAVELLFGNPFLTPTADEEGMYHAQAAAFRSASLARQVGAALCRADGTIVSTGMNDVPKSGGGGYWCSDSDDNRDFRWGYDTSDQMRENLLGEILQRLKDAKWLSQEKQEQTIAELVREALRDENHPILKGAQFSSTIDYVRAVHAEMSAISDAARHGISTKDCILYTTTFPCHDCAKHMVAAGIRRAVYIEPYRKSLVQDLFPDSIAVDPGKDQTSKVRFEPFVGVSPRRYANMFGLFGRKRKHKDGSTTQWQSTSSSPLLPEFASAVGRIAAEQKETKMFLEQLYDKSILAVPR